MYKKLFLPGLIFSILLLSTYISKAQDFNKAMQYFNSGQYKEAATEFEGTLVETEKQFGKNDTSVYALRLMYTGVSYYRSGNYVKAETFFLRFIAAYESKNAIRDPRYCYCCRYLADLYQATDNYKEAEKYYNKTKNIYEEIVGKEHTFYIKTCEKIAELYMNSGNYRKAEPLYIEITNIKKKLQGKQNADYSKICGKLAEIYRLNGKYKLAEQLFIETKNITENIYGKQHSEYAFCCNSLALLYSQTGNYKESELLYKESKEIYENLFGNEHQNYASICMNLAGLYLKMENYQKSEPLFLEVKNIFEKVFGKEHQNYATVCDNQALLYDNMGNYKEAEKLYSESKNIREKVFGKEHPSYALTCNNMGSLYMNTGNYKKAEQLYLESKEIREKVLGEHHPDYAQICCNLAFLYATLGNYQKAETLYIDAKDIREKVLGKEHPDYAVNCNNLALLYKSIYKNFKAMYFFLEAKNIFEKVFGKEHPKYALCCNNIALLYKSMGKYKKAEELFIEARDIDMKIFGENHIEYSTICNNMASLYQDMGDYKKSEQLYLEARRIIEEVFGKQHPNYFVNCNNIASLYNEMEKYQKAEQFYIEANRLLNSLSAQSADYMSENEREIYLNTEINFNYEIYNSVFLTQRKKNKTLAGVIYNNTLNLKGQLLKSTIAIRKAILQRGDASIIRIYNNMNRYSKILAKQYTLPLKKRREDINEIEEEVNTLEKELNIKTSNLSGFKNLTDFNTEWQDIQKSLNYNEAAIEFIKFDYYADNDWTDSTFYYALILRKDYEYPKVVFLFEEKEFEIIFNRKLFISEYDYIKKLYDPQSSELFKLVWQPLEQHLKETKNIYISPTGFLNKIAFDAISYDTTSLLSDKYKIIYCTSTTQVLNKLGLFQKDIKNSVLFGGIEYDIGLEEMEKYAINFKSQTLSTTQSKVQFAGSLEVDSLSRNISWGYLPGTMKETEGILSVLNKNNIEVNLYKDYLGSEEQFKALEQTVPSIIHISTHGYYFPEPKKKKRFNNTIEENIKFMHSENPLLRSGFILAGGNATFRGNKIPEGVEDGVLTALEISNMNLFKTKLAVLSACQTGLGDVKGNEGVYGLQRAFKMAGVDYLIFSLWEVPDKQTKELMVSFYENWFSGMEIRDAFKKAQNYMKAKYKGVKGAAFAWAAFVLMK